MQCKARKIIEVKYLQGVASKLGQHQWNTTWIDLFICSFWEVSDVLRKVLEIKGTVNIVDMIVFVLVVSFKEDAMMKVKEGPLRLQSCQFFTQLLLGFSTSK